MAIIFFESVFHVDVYLFRFYFRIKVEFFFLRSENCGGINLKNQEFFRPVNFIQEFIVLLISSNSKFFRPQTNKMLLKKKSRVGTLLIIFGQFLEKKPENSNLQNFTGHFSDISCEKKIFC